MATTPKPVLIGRIDAELPGKLIKLVADDMERARREREERAKRKKAAKGKRTPDP